jgi:hypothetical protein
VPDKLSPSTAPKLPGNGAPRYPFAACILPAAASGHPGLEPGRYYRVR